MSSHNSRNDRDQASNHRQHGESSSTRNYHSSVGSGHNYNHSHGRVPRSGDEQSNNRKVGRSEGQGRHRRDTEDSSTNSASSRNSSSLGYTEVRISRLTKVLSLLDSRKEFFATCSQIEDLILLEENQIYIQKSFSKLMYDLEQIFYGLPIVPWRVVGVNRFTTFLNKLLDGMPNNYSRMIKWMIGLTHEKSFHVPECLAVFQSLTLGMVPKMNKKQLATLTSCIIEILEESSSKVFRILCSLCVSCLLSNADTKMSSFKDFVDVVIGWMVSDMEDCSIPSFCANILQVLSEYFKKDLEFTSSMLAQLFDDLQDSELTLNSQKVPYSSTNKIFGLLKATAAMLNLGCSFDKLFLNSAFESLIQRIALLVQNKKLPETFRHELISATNECVSFSGIDGLHLRSFLRDQLTYFNSSLEWTMLPKVNVVDFLANLSSWIEATSSQAQLDAEAEEMFKESTICVDIVRPHLDPEEQVYLLKIMHSLLKARKISCLQTSYSWLVSKLKLDEDGNYTADQETTLFVLVGLADIAGIKTGSILSQWALDPPIFDLLISLVSQSKNKLHEYENQVGASALQLLRAHCEAHSHFVSSIASSKSYESTGTRSTRFLPNLMKFWLDQLDEPSQQYKYNWLFDWIFSFVKTSAPFIILLIETNQCFYTKLVHVLLTKPELHKSLVTLLKWINEDNFYQQSEFLLNLSRTTISKLLLMDNIDHNIRAEATNEFKNLPPKIVVEPESTKNLEDLSLSGTSNRSMGLHFSDLTTCEFNAFLHNLLASDKTESAQIYSAEYINATVQFLLQSKLKTSLGRPQEFFGLLGGVFKRYRKGKPVAPEWKIDFVYQLERNIINAIYGSTFITCDLPPAVRSFYVTNKTPCIEWLKRMRTDIAEVSLAAECFSNAFLNATRSGEDLTAKFALLELGDSEGLKAMSELAGFYYLQNKLEKAVKVIKNKTPESVQLDAFQALVLKRTEAILNTASASLESWPETKGEDIPISAGNSLLFKLRSSQYKTLLNLQAETYSNKSNLPDLISLKDLNTYKQLNFVEMIQIGELIKKCPSFTTEYKQAVESIKIETMMNHGNLEYVRNLMTSHGLEETITKVNSDVVIQTTYYKNLADLFYKEGNYEASAQLYISLLDMIEKNGNLLELSFKAKFYLSFASKIESSDTFFDVALRSSMLLSTLQDRDSVLESLYETTILVQPDVNVWFDYGNFAYSRGSKSSSSAEVATKMKSLAQVCYSKYFVSKETAMKKIQKKQNSWKPIQVRTRLLSLHVEGFRFNPAEVLVQDDWLPLLPSLTRISDLRCHLVRRFPEQASFLAAAYSKQRKFKRLEGRKGIFDSVAFSFTEANEETFNSVCHQDGCHNLHFVRKQNQVSLEHEDFESKEAELRNAIDVNVFLIIEELERIGSLREELWSWSIEKIISDSTKRISALRRDMARDSDPLKVKAYIFPMLTYLTELWNITKDANTIAEIAFLHKHGPKIQAFLTKLENCKTPDDFNNAMDQVVHFGSLFDTSSVSKLELGAVSPKLSNLQFSSVNSLPSVCIPGFPSNITLLQVHSIIICLQTKAKPKRLSFLGSNGRLYEYLVKGNENLNIDAGVMQLLKITQELSELTTRTYSITPFGERGGFIQIVERAQPIYLMYRRHLQRINSAERPTYMFWRILNDLGFSDRSNFEALKSAFEELVKETDSEIISRELLLCAEDSSSWMYSVRNFTRDAAIGATIGYLVGIGDRHLDNILLNPRNGHLIHVDFSLLFGKGTTLQVPEIVPFRLTQNFVASLQYPGLTGPFRVYMEEFLGLFKLHQGSFLFGVEEIAVATQLEDSLTVDPTIILLSELQSAVQLLRIRSKNIANILQSLMMEVLETIDRKSSSFSWSARSDHFVSIDKLKKKLNRWRRLLANVDPLIQFIAKYAQPDNCILENFQEIVAREWLPNVVHFWCHSKMDELLDQTNLFPDQLKLADDTLQTLLQYLPPSEKIIQYNEEMLSSKEVAVDRSKTHPKLTSTIDKLESYGQKTVEEIIASATNSDNLCQMFEGWTPWV